MENNGEVVYLYLDDIIPNRFQPREVFDEQALKELAVSIKEHGVIQPIIVRKVENKYEIIAGERRYKASTMAGLTKIPAIVKNFDDKESSKVALIENLQRKDLSPIEEARTYQKILELEDSMTQEQLAATMGKTQSSVSNKLRLLALPDEIQDALLKEKISERHARSLLNIEDKNDQIKMLDRIITDKMTVRELDKVIKEMKEGTKEDKTEISAPTEPDIAPTEPNVSVDNLASVSVIDNSSNSLSSEAKDLSASDIVEETTKNEENKEKEAEPETNPPLTTFNLSSLGSKKNEETTEAPTEPPKSILSPDININPTAIDINKVRETSVDIGAAQKPSFVEVTDLMKPPVVKEEPKEEIKDEPEFKFVPSFQNEDKGSTSSISQDIQEQFSKFFNANVNESNSSDTNQQSTIASSVSLPSLTIPAPETKKDISVAINDIMNAVSSLEKKGYKMNVAEEDGLNEYKITISLQKNE